MSYLSSTMTAAAERYSDSPYLHGRALILVGHSLEAVAQGESAPLGIGPRGSRLGALVAGVAVTAVSVVISVVAYHVLGTAGSVGVEGAGSGPGLPYRSFVFVLPVIFGAVSLLVPSLSRVSMSRSGAALVARGEALVAGQAVVDERVMQEDLKRDWQSAILVIEARRQARQRSRMMTMNGSMIGPMGPNQFPR